MQVKHPVLFGEFDLNIDDKNRLLIPSEVRQRINQAEFGEGFFLVIGINRLPWIYPERYYEELATRAPADLIPAEAVLAFDQLYFARAHRLEPDKQGRVLLPEKTLRRANIMKEVTLIGARDHLEIYNRADWDARREELERRGPEIARAAKRVQQDAQAGNPPAEFGQPGGTFISQPPRREET